MSGMLEKFYRKVIRTRCSVISIQNSEFLTSLTEKGLVKSPLSSKFDVSSADQRSSDK
jgi:hypothetical protein